MGPIGSGIGFPYTDIADARIIVYGNPMRILWDEPKRLANLDKHDLDFADLTPEFFEAALILPTRDRRLAAIGRLADGTVTVIFLRLGTEALSVISMRSASIRERRLLNEH